MPQEAQRDPSSSKEALNPTKIAGRYALFQPIASGGMATVYVGRLIGPQGFGRTVAIKCMHEHVARDPELVKSFLDEAQLAARIRHPNVVPTLDVVSSKGELFLVMDYVHGESLSRLMSEARSQGVAIPLGIISNILTSALQGLHAAHELKDERGKPLRVVHRDVSPQNVLVGTDGVTRVMDFGIAKATTSSAHTSTGVIKGKVSYMAPEQMTSREVTPATDVFAMGIVAWELLVGRRMRPGKGDITQILALLSEQITPPSSVEPSVPEALSAAVVRALAREPGDRPASAMAMARELARLVPPATTWEVAEWVEKLLGDRLSARSEMVQEVEIASGLIALPPSIPPPKPASAPPPRQAPSPAPSREAPAPAASPPAALPLPLPLPSFEAGAAPSVRRADAAVSGEFELSRSVSMPGVRIGAEAGEARAPFARRLGLAGAALLTLGAVPALSLWLLLRFSSPVARVDAGPVSATAPAPPTPVLPAASTWSAPAPSGPAPSGPAPSGPAPQAGSAAPPSAGVGSPAAGGPLKPSPSPLAAPSPSPSPSPSPAGARAAGREAEKKPPGPRPKADDRPAPASTATYSEQ